MQQSLEFLSISSYQKLRLSLNQRDSLICAIALYSGESPSNVLGLRVSDVYEKNSPRTFLKFQTRKVPLHPALKKILESYPAPRGEWLFPAPRDSSVPISLSTFDKALRKAIAEMGEPIKVSSHLFKNTFQNALMCFPQGFEIA